MLFLLERVRGETVLSRHRSVDGSSDEETPERRVKLSGMDGPFSSIKSFQMFVLLFLKITQITCIHCRNV